MDKSVIELFDGDGDGILTRDEVGHIVRTMGYNPSRKELDMIIEQNRLNPDHLSPHDLQLIVSQCPSPHQNSLSDLIEAFRVFDRDENGMITENELRAILTQLGETIAVDEVNELLQQVQVDERGRVDYQQFIQLILNC